MSPRKFDRFLVDVHIASNPKLSRLTVQERWCHVAGILSLAALAPIRGHLLVGDAPADAQDIARRAGVSVAIARSTVEKLRRVGVLEHDDDLGCDIVHDFADWNPAPKTDKTGAERARRYREKQTRVTPSSRRDSRDVTGRDGGIVTPTEVEVEVELEEKTPPLPPEGGRTRDRIRYEGELAEFGAEHFPGIDVGYVSHFAGRLRASGHEPTVAALRPLVEQHRPVEAA